MDVLKIRAFWDERAKVWGAVSNDIPGFITEADTLDELAAIIPALAIDLLTLQNRADAAGYALCLETDIRAFPTAVTAQLQATLF